MWVLCHVVVVKKKKQSAEVEDGESVCQIHLVMIYDFGKRGHYCPYNLASDFFRNNHHRGYRDHDSHCTVFYYCYSHCYKMMVDCLKMSVHVSFDHENHRRSHTHHDNSYHAWYHGSNHCHWKSDDESSFVVCVTWWILIPL